MMSALLTLILWLPMPAGAIENIECEYALGGERKITLVDGHELTLGRGDVLIRGHLQARELKGATRMVYGVRDWFDVARVFSHPDYGYFELTSGDLIVFLSDDRRRILGRAFYGETPAVPGRGGRSRSPRPMITQRREHRQSALNPAQIDRLFREHVPVVVIKNLAEPEYQSLRARLTPDIVAYDAHRKSGARTYAVTASVATDLAHFERAYDGVLKTELKPHRQPRLDLGGGTILPESIVYHYHLWLMDKDGRRIDVGADDYVFLMDRHDEVLMKFHLQAPDIVLSCPYDAFETELCRSLAFAKRMVIIRHK